MQLAKCAFCQNQRWFLKTNLFVPFTLIKRRNHFEHEYTYVYRLKMPGLTCYDGRLEQHLVYIEIQKFKQKRNNITHIAQPEISVNLLRPKENWTRKKYK